MQALTMDYPIEDKALLTQLKPDDEITATVHVGDPMPHDVHVVKPPLGRKVKSPSEAAIWMRRGMPDTTPFRAETTWITGWQAIFTIPTGDTATITAG